MPTADSEYRKCHLKVPCSFDANPNQFEGEGKYCRYKKTQVGCWGNPEVTSPGKCHFVAIGLVNPEYYLD